MTTGTNSFVCSTYLKGQLLNASLSQTFCPPLPLLSRVVASSRSCTAEHRVRCPSERHSESWTCGEQRQSSHSLTTRTQPRGTSRSSRTGKSSSIRFEPVMHDYVHVTVTRNDLGFMNNSEDSDKHKIKTTHMHNALLSNTMQI